MQLCLKCGTENRNKAKFCCGCGANLTILFCHACNKEFILKEGLRFCDNCGKELQPINAAENITRDEQPIPSEGITIEFGYSSSHYLPEAIKQAKKSYSFFRWGTGKRVRFRATFDRKDGIGLYRMIEAIGGIRNRKIFVDGKEKEWNAVITPCYMSYLKSGKKEKYCRGNRPDLWFAHVNLFGCYMFPLSLDDESNVPDEKDFWLFGNLNENGNFVFNKNKMREKIISMSKQSQICPAFDTMFALKVLDNFPIMVNPQKDKDWEYCARDGSRSEEIIVKEGKIFLFYGDEDLTGYKEEAVGVLIENEKAAIRLANEIKKKAEILVNLDRGNKEI